MCRQSSTENEQSTYLAVLRSLNAGDVVSFNNSGGANAQDTPELKVELPPTYFVAADMEYEVRENDDGELELWYRERDNIHAPDKLYDTIETIEIIAEGAR